MSKIENNQRKFYNNIFVFPLEFISFYAAIIEASGVKIKSIKLLQEFGI